MLRPITAHGKHLKAFRRRMRHRPTLAERAIGKLLHSLKQKFAAQQCFHNPSTGNCYIADFWLWEHKIIIECDGKQHLTVTGLTKDRTRDAEFVAAGIRTLRIRNDVAIGMSATALRELL